MCSIEILEMNVPLACMNAPYRHYDSVIQSDGMTAIISAYTPEGFVIGADGLRRDVKARSIVTENAQKVFFVSGDGVSLAYAWAGATNLVYGFGTQFDLISESENAIESLNANTLSNFWDYVDLFSKRIHGRLLSSFGTYLGPEAAAFCPKDQLARALFVGYFKDSGPCRAQIVINRDGQVVLKPTIVEFIKAPSDFNMFSIPGVIGRKFRTRGAVRPETTEEAFALVKTYLQECVDSQEDQECRDVGGHIHVASVTPSKCEWIVPPLSDVPA